MGRRRCQRVRPHDRRGPQARRARRHRDQSHRSSRRQPVQPRGPLVRRRPSGREPLSGSGQGHGPQRHPRVSPLAPRCGRTLRRGGFRYRLRVSSPRCIDAGTLPVENAEPENRRVRRQPRESHAAVARDARRRHRVRSATAAAVAVRLFTVDDELHADEAPDLLEMFAELPDLWDVNIRHLAARLRCRRDSVPKRVRKSW